jgi:hypothetical protein
MPATEPASRGAAELLADPVGDQDLTHRCRQAQPLHPHPRPPPRSDRPGDALDQRLPVGKLLGRGRWRLDRHGSRLAHANSLSTIEI